MAIIDYSGYTFQELMDVRSSINSEAHPNNCKALELEISSRGDEVEIRKELRKEEIKNEFSIAEERVKIIGYFQLVASIGIAIILIMALFSDNGSSLFSQIVGWFFVGLNAVAGYTAVKENYKFYWLSILNQALQVPSIAIGTIIANYSGLGGGYLIIYWGAEESGINFSANLDPGFSFLQLSESLSSGSISFDLLALVFMSALLTVKDAKSNTNQ